jgi:anti-anti-sigma factor
MQVTYPTPTDYSFTEIDLATAPAFLAAMCEMIDRAGARAVAIDCSAITFMDSSAFHALVDAYYYARERDHRLVIRGLRPNCEKVVRLCDVAGLLTIAT